MKKILHILNNDYDGIFHFVENLISNNLKDCDNKILVKYSNNEKYLKIDTGKPFKYILINPIIILKYPKEFYVKLINKFKRDFFNFFYKTEYLFNFFFDNLDFKKLKNKIDKINVVVIYTFRETLSPSDLIKIQNQYNCKIIFYPLDNELLSGGTHFENETNSLKLKKKDNRLINVKNKYISNLNINWIAGNEYINQKIKNSKIYNRKNHKIFKIYNTIKKFHFSDDEITSFKNRNNLNQSDLVLFFGGLKLNDKRKGIDELFYCLDYYENLSDKKFKITLVTIGKEKNFRFNYKKIRNVHFEYLNDQKKLDLLLRSCNIFLNLTKYDFGPVMCEKAFVNDLFILSSDQGIAQEIIFNDYNGYIYRNKSELINNFEKIIDLSFNKKEPLFNKNISSIKEKYTLNKSEHFSKVFNEKLL